jgi:hypothetical protein
MIINLMKTPVPHSSMILISEAVKDREVYEDDLRNGHVPRLDYMEISARQTPHHL